MLFVLIFISVKCLGQTVINRTTPSNTINDPRGMNTINLFIPRYADTSTANLQKGIDSCGAIIYTYLNNSFWLRGCSPKKWISTGGSVNVTSFTFYGDSSAIICFGNGVCDTFALSQISNFLNISNIYNNSVTGGVIYNDSCLIIQKGSGAAVDTICVPGIIGSYEFINDSTVQICYTTVADPLTPICNNYSFPATPLMLGQNWIRILSPGKWEFGSTTENFSPGLVLSHNTYTSTWQYKMFWDGETVYDYPHTFRQRQSFQASANITAFHSLGNVLRTQPDYNNVVNFGVHYTGKLYSDTSDHLNPNIDGYFGNKRIGYWIGAGLTNQGSSGLLSDDDSSKTSALFFNTLDGDSTNESFTFFGANRFTGPYYGIAAGATYPQYAILSGLTNGNLKLWKYPTTRDDGVVVSGSTKVLYMKSDTTIGIGTVTFSGGTNIYNSDGIATGNRLFALGAKSLDITGGDLTYTRATSDFYIDSTEIDLLVQDTTGTSTSLIKEKNDFVYLQHHESGVGGNPQLRLETKGFLFTTGAISLPYNSGASNATLGATDYTYNCLSGTFTVTLPTAVGITGRIYVIKNSGAGTITIATTSSQTIDGVTTQTLSTQYSSYTVQSNGANWIIL